MSQSAEQVEHVKHGPVETGVDELILRRWSPRAYAEKAVRSEDLTKIFTAAAWAASSSNEQPWRFLMGRKGDATYTKILSCLVEANQAWAKSAPVLVLSFASANFARNGHANDYALHDLGAASATLSLEATALGMHTHGMGGFDKEKAREVFAIPADHLMGAVWAIGYLGDPETLEERVKAMELAPRTRKPLNEIVFAEWGTPATL